METGGFVTEEIHVLSLDSAIPPDRPVSVLHLDVEGYEQNALTGGMQTIARWKPVLILESVPEASWIEENIAPLGYARRASVNNNSVFSVNDAEPAFGS
jgi:hypothetical protein